MCTIASKPLIDYEDIARFLLTDPDPQRFLGYLEAEKEEIEKRYAR
jgi:hypothetical protein